MADKVTAVDVGTNAVRAVTATLGDHPRLTHLGQLGLPAGAVREGEVVDVAAVAAQLRSLWKQAGFSDKAVRVGIASARVILRVVEMPVLSDGDTRAALKLQLGDYVPLAPEDTVFDFQPLRHDAAAGDQTRQLLLAAAPRDAVQPLVDAVRQAGLKVVAVDLVAAALARTTRPAGPFSPPAIDAVVSIGAGMIVVVVARAGEPLFARTVTNLSGRVVTDRIATELAVPQLDAERLKRRLPEDVPADLAARLHGATDPAVAEICAEIGDSLDYYAAQAGNPMVDAVTITGGGVLLDGLRERLQARLGLPVHVADPFARFDHRIPGYEAEDLPFLAPFMASAIGLALGGAGRSKQVNLLADSARLLERSRWPFVLGGLAAVAVLGCSYLVLDQRSALADVRTERTALEEAVVPARLVAAQRAASAGGIAGADPALAVLELARRVDVDWATVAAELDLAGEPMGVGVIGFVGTSTEPVEAATTTGTDAVEAATTTGTATVAASAAGGMGSIAVTGTAVDLLSVAAWLDAVNANPRFAEAWLTATSEVPLEDGTTQTQFTAAVVVTDLNAVVRALPEALS